MTEGFILHIYMYCSQYLNFHDCAPQNVLDDTLYTFCVHILAFIPLCLWLYHIDLSSLTRDQTCTSCIGITVLTTGPPGKSPAFLSLKHQLFGIISSYKVQVFLYFKASLHPLSLPTNVFFSTHVVR